MPRPRLPLLLLLATPLLAGCDNGPVAQAQTEPPKAQPVGIVTLEPKPTPVVRELPGRIAATRVSEVRARVQGIVASRHFNQGSDVKAGDELYRIDPAQYEIELKATQAALAKAEAVLEQEEQNVERMKRLAPTQAVAQSALDIALATQRQAKADVDAREADVARARLNLDYTIIRAPISGRIGRALVTEGALVSADDATHVATIQRLDPIYADFTQSVTELSQLKRDLEAGDIEEYKGARVSLVLDDGTVYASSGRLLFSDTTVDPGTGQVTLRGEFPNPKLDLLPGMYVRVRIEQGIDPDALSVPQQAVRRNDAGGSELYVVRQDNRVHPVPVRLGRTAGENWLVLSGVKPGDRVVVDGFQKFVPGDAVAPTPWRQRRAEGDKASPPATTVTATPAALAN